MSGARIVPPSRITAPSNPFPTGKCPIAFAVSSGKPTWMKSLSERPSGFSIPRAPYRAFVISQACSTS